MSQPYPPPEPQQPGQPGDAQHPYPGAYSPGSATPSDQYPQPPYPDSPYAQSPYAQASGGQQYPAAAPTNVLAIVALVSAFFIPIAGVVCGHIALGQIKRTGENGRGLALAGLIIGYVFTALIVLLIVLVLIVPFVILGTVGSLDGVGTY